MSGALRTVEQTGAQGRSAHQLLVLPLHRPLGAPEAGCILEQLQEVGAVRIVDAVVAAPAEGRGHWCVETHSPGADDELPPAAWAWLVARAFGDASDPGSGGAPGGGRHDPGLSDSFVAEMHDAAATVDGCIVAIVTRFDAGAAVAAFRPFPATRLIYGDLPDWMLEQARTVPPSTVGD